MPMYFRCAPCLVFVYGTLLRGESNHHCMSGARLLGHWRSAPRFSLYSLGRYPVLCCGGRHRVFGEVYRVTPHILMKLDELEGYPHEYQRMLMQTPWGPAWVYVQQSRPSAGVLLAGGDWRKGFRR